MVETRINSTTGTTEEVSNPTPETITTSMILEDLNNGVDRTGIKEKYDLETWEVTQMFQHPALKGKKAKKIRKLSFNFVDDTPQEVTFDEAIAAETPVHNPNQLDLEDQIAEEEAEELDHRVDNHLNDRQY